MASTKQSAERFKVLAADARLAIIERLKDGPTSVTELAGALGISQPAVSQHLRVLKAAGLVEDRKDGYWVYYSLSPGRLMDYKRSLDEVCLCGCDCCAPEEITVLEAYKAQLEAELARVEQQLAQLQKGDESSVLALS